MNFFKICSAAGNRAAARLDGRIHAVKKECPDGRERAKETCRAPAPGPDGFVTRTPACGSALAVLVLAGMAGFVWRCTIR
ncbi:MAG: hypothetical protein ACLR7U_01010 [Ruthenibacterium lactatiformans]